MENKSTKTRAEMMEFTFTPQNERVKCPFFEKNVSTELSSDYTLPDYLPEIRKILGIRHKLSPISRYIGNTVEFSGRMDYELIYCSDSGELTSVPLGEDFSLEVSPEIPPWIDWASCGEAYASFTADSVNARATAPRKLNIKCRLNGNVICYGYDEQGLGVTTEKNAERLQSKADFSSFHRNMSEVIELGDEIPLTGGTERYRYISSNGRVNITDTSMSGNQLNCKGELVYDTMAESRESGEIVHFDGKIPFTQAVDLQSDTDGYTVHSATGYCNEIKISDGGDKYLLDAEIILETDSLGEGKAILTQDIFIPCHDCEVSYRDFKYETLFKNGCEKVVVNENISLKETPEDEIQIIDCITGIKLDPIKSSDESSDISGSMKAKIIYKSNGEYSSHDVTVPFSVSLGIIPPEEKRSVAVYPSISDVRCRAKGKEAALEADIALSYVIMQRESMKISDSIKAMEKGKNPQSGITVYYPEKDESLWSVAKKFGISLSELASLNGLSGQNEKEPIVGKKFIMIS